MNIVVAGVKENCDSSVWRNDVARALQVQLARMSKLLTLSISVDFYGKDPTTTGEIAINLGSPPRARR